MNPEIIQGHRLEPQSKSDWIKNKKGKETSAGVLGIAQEPMNNTNMDLPFIP